MSDQEFTSSYQVVMPRLGLTMVDGKIVEWYKQDGDWVDKGEPLFSIENEKATLDIEAPASGKLEIQVEPDIVVPILSPVGLIHTKEKSGSQHHQKKIETQRATMQSNTMVDIPIHVETKARAGEKIRVSPKVRKTARPLGLDLSMITGSGMRGMIVSADLVQSGEHHPVKATPVARRKAAEAGVDLSGITGTGPRGMVSKEDVEKILSETSLSQPTEEITINPMVGLRKVIAERLGKSWNERPQVNLTTEVDASLFVKAREQINRELVKKEIKISFNTLLIKIVAQAMEEFPYMNVSLLPEGLQQHQQANIGLAVDTPKGLMVPQVKNAATKNFETIQKELDAVVKRTLEGTTTWDDLTGGTFTITNLGAFEIDAFSPIINPPECAILGVGRIHEKPVVIDGQIVVRAMMAISVSFDHRLVDGAPAARFLQRVKQYIEQPFLWSLWKGES
jgi:pyruvate dehydrogenase E2 component (dihydrolipoamide acetyltransferase)